MGKINIKIEELSRFFYVPFPDSQYLQELDTDSEYTAPAEDGGVYADMDWLKSLLEGDVTLEPEPDTAADWRRAGEKEGFFHITSMSREDIKAVGYDPSAMTDDELRRMAEKIGDDIVGNQYWVSLKEYCAWNNIPKLEKEGE